MIRRAALIALFAVACGGKTPTASTTPTPKPAKSSNSVDLGGGASGYLATPTSAGKHGAVIVIQEWWGLNDWIRANADKFAKDGYVALAVDLYRGKAAANADEAHELMRGLPEDRALKDLHAAFDYLAKRDDVEPTKIASVGWCMGGGYSLALAVDEPGLRAMVINYGRLVTDDKKLEGIKASALGNFAGQDKGIPVDDVDAFTIALKKKGKDVDIKVYVMQGHAFMNPNNKNGYMESAAEDAWSRIDAFLKKTIGT
jgi:carboxymethylenebutenolidase